MQLGETNKVYSGYPEHYIGKLKTQITPNLLWLQNNDKDLSYELAFVSKALSKY